MKEDRWSGKTTVQVKLSLEIERKRQICKKEEGTSQEKIGKECQHNSPQSISARKEVKKRLISQYDTK